jgi:hypothetical protein
MYCYVVKQNSGNINKAKRKIEKQTYLKEEAALVHMENCFAKLDLANCGIHRKS